MAEDALYALNPYVVWAPFFMHGKFRYWAPTGRGRMKIGKDGIPRVELYNHAHISDGSLWLRLLPPGEKPDEQPGAEAFDQPRRPPKGASDANTEDEDI